ncbi:MAG TPA: ImmA/IrrE family metallo-endopeptidase [Gemmataceae bacterium]|nr:ImmA/IrrE family metallo-endopeptidase [Gemmataceae bacterium]
MREHTSKWESDAARVQNLLREHLPSAAPSGADPPPLTVGDVAARLQVDSALGGRLSAADRETNSRLRTDTTPVPEELGLPHFEKWRTTLGVRASPYYWRAFRQATVLLAMGRSNIEGMATVRQIDDCVLVADAIRRLFAAADLPWPPLAHRPIAPVPLDRLIATYNLVHEEVLGLTRAVAGAFLSRWNIQRPELLEDASPLAGFLFANTRGGYIVVRGDDPLPRRRFTAAHELGHYLLHFLPRLDVANDVETYLIQDDDGKMVREEEKPSSDKALSLPRMEREANQFAAELLMPESVCRMAHEHYAGQFRATAQFLEHHLASHLLVSGDAMRWRLRNLNLPN